MSKISVIAAVAALAALVLAFVVSEPLLVAGLCLFALLCLVGWYVLERRDRS
ncbi:hypothetical protein [Nonomuraea cavernae]|uniref:hypothetical protein n=1 Tax=Nonomuraea cavernae TaxID=2045107 RepID=UPI001664197F|nr:hypothetical protein [Nonomuraea cavernae]MCA2186889.1 hypothetical protein [Nonomuraea cavernae]